MNKAGTEQTKKIQSADPDTLVPEALDGSDPAATGARRMEAELDQYNAVSPVLSGGDIDARWQAAESSGEETPGGHQATPDQDEVDEIGRAFGMEIQDNQELHTHDELLGKRDEQRWELDRRSAGDDSI